MSHASYLEDLFSVNSLKVVTDELARRINKDKKAYQFVGIACRGLSGTIPASIVSLKTKLPLIVVRKSTENSHSMCTVEYPDGLCGNFAIIDEFIGSGNTLKIIMGSVHQASGFNLRAKKLFLYRSRNTSYGTRANGILVSQFEYCNGKIYDENGEVISRRKKNENSDSFRI